MRRLTILLLALMIFLPALAPQSEARPQVPAHTQPRVGTSQTIRSTVLEQPATTCPQILQISSTDWIARANEASADKSAPAPAKSTSATPPASTPAEKTIRAIAAYGKCYDARTDRLAAALGKSGKGPLMGATGNFRDFERAVQSFTTKALAESDPPADAVKSAYAALYEKQFRYAFYQSYDQPITKPSAPPAAKSAPKPTPSATTPASAATAPSAPTAATTATPPTKEVDPLTLAKNHFGELLSDLQDDKMHDLHAAFGQILVLNSVGASMQLAIYRYAIFLLEPPASQPPASSAHAGNPNQPFAPPPF